MAGASFALVTTRELPVSRPRRDLVRLAAKAASRSRRFQGQRRASALGVRATGFAVRVHGLSAPQRPREREWLERLAADERTIVAFESPHRITQTLSDLICWSIDKYRYIEITKINEELCYHQLWDLMDSVRLG